jgi:hypothetical protein
VLELLDPSLAVGQPSLKLIGLRLAVGQPIAQVAQRALAGVQLLFKLLGPVSRGENLVAQLDLLLQRLAETGVRLIERLRRSAEVAAPAPDAAKTEPDPRSTRRSALPGVWSAALMKIARSLLNPGFWRCYPVARPEASGIRIGLDVPASRRCFA